jgi:hypothetical protein
MKDWRRELILWLARDRSVVLNASFEGGKVKVTPGAIIERNLYRGTSVSFNTPVAEVSGIGDEQV